VAAGTSEDTVQNCYRLTLASEAPDLPTSIALPVQSRGRPGLCSAELDDLFVSRTRTTDANVAK